MPTTPIKIHPLRNAIKRLYADKSREFCLFALDINTDYRATGFLPLRFGQVAHLKVGDRPGFSRPGQGSLLNSGAACDGRALNCAGAFTVAAG